MHSCTRVLNSLSLAQHALYLAQKHNQHELYLKIQCVSYLSCILIKSRFERINAQHRLEDENNVRDALVYIASLEFADVRFAAPSSSTVLT